MEFDLESTMEEIHVCNTLQLYIKIYERVKHFHIKFMSDFSQIKH